VLHEVHHVAKRKLCDVVACMHERALYCGNPDWMEVVEALIGRFHTYEHDYQCHVLYNLLRTAN
jgi:hypothetical protein